MDRPGDSQNPTRTDQQESSPVKVVPPSYRSLYLICYNAISALLWAVVLGRVVLIAGIHGPKYVFAGVGEWTKWTQTLAALEIAHAGIGLVRAPLLTTLMQVASRFLLVWLIAFNFPSTVSASPAYTTMLLAWSITEVIRYSYFAVNLAYGGVPAFMTWLRYNTFFVLYPMGISSAYVLFTHMMVQRQKVMRNIKAKKSV
ncbi:hypothetical protein LTR78_000486 [Recurvomyces mirabilis]|uniref:Very-long-chain (3R)-3-hydroxyacyl-CoA dehydratase n=1 Tax=Recurvomyces mirabilis TaxID=574656 RepID=A0AAE0WY18_9PEZI|nr:hypothetical protein LTR78_000486 [Recurvomyces mirabilis]KAK5162141.1 hypothetical protein LTS14_000487 [Recurvomyces mirabilis]